MKNVMKNVLKQECDDVLKNGCWLWELGRDELTATVIRLQNQRTEKDEDFFYKKIKGFVHRFAHKYHPFFHHYEGYFDTVAEIQMMLWEKLFLFDPSRHNRYITYAFICLQHDLAQRIDALNTQRRRPRNKDGKIVNNVSFEKLLETEKTKWVLKLSDFSEDFKINVFIDNISEKLDKPDFELIRAIIEDKKLREENADMEQICLTMSEKFNCKPRKILNRIRKLAPVLKGL